MQKTIEVFYFNELSEEMKTFTFNNYREINVNSYWLENFEDELNICGLEIYSFEPYNKKLSVLPLEDEQRIVNNLQGLFSTKEGLTAKNILSLCEDFNANYYKGRFMLFFLNLETYLLDYLEEKRKYLLSRDQVIKTLKSKLFTAEGVLVN